MKWKFDSDMLGTELLTLDILHVVKILFTEIV